jgi:copper chaperone NosL
MTPSPARRMRRMIAAVLLAPLALLACSIEPEPVHVGAEECAHCSMLISDRRFAAQVLNTKGRAWKFDSIECLRGFIQAGTLQPADVHSAWVTDAAAGTEWVAADAAYFLRSPAVSSPMGGGLIAYAAEDAARAARADVGGEVLSWDDLLALPAQIGSDAGAHAHHGRGG